MRTKMKKKLSIMDLRPNDIEGALTFAESRMRAGTYSFENDQVLLQMQDDPTELQRRLVELEQRIKEEKTRKKKG